MCTSTDRSAGGFHGENDTDNEIEEDKESDESDATFDYDIYESNGSFYSTDGEEIRENHSEEVYDFKRKELKWLKILGRNVNWEIEDERFKYFDQLFRLVKDWKFQLPDLRKIFHQDEMDFFLVQAVIVGSFRGLSFIEFVARTGYKDRFDVPNDGVDPVLLRRTTAVHRAAGKKSDQWQCMIEHLFCIYDRFDLNYVDESGLTHFHAACMSWACQGSVQKFLEQGLVDPNLIWPETGDSPLHLSVFHQYAMSTEMLMRKGANPNLANKDGLTPLHMAGKKSTLDGSVRRIIEICEDMKLPLQVNAQDNFGNTTVHLALERRCIYSVKFLLRNGADPNLANNDGSTPLHIICRNTCYGWAEALFEVTDEINRTVQVDARDNLGRTPLQLAVLNLLPDAVESLLEHGADLSSFVLLPENDDRIERIRMNKLTSAFAALAIYESLEKRRYEVDDYALITIKIFSIKSSDYPRFHYLMLSEHSANFETRWKKKKKLARKLKNKIILPSVRNRDYEDSLELERWRDATAMTPTLSLYDLMRLRPEEAAKVLTYRDYFQLIDYPEIWWGLYKDYVKDAHRHLYENVPRGFFRRWALDYFFELIGYRLPILCCEIIIDQLRNEDLGNICFAATGQDP